MQARNFLGKTNQRSLRCWHELQRKEGDEMKTTVIAAEAAKTR